MKKLNVSLVRARNIVEIVTAIAEHDGISRAEIANRASVSVMTVSNIMEVLLRNGAVYETEQRTENVGRNPALVYFSRTKWIMVLNLIDQNFSCSYMTLELKPFDVLTQEYDKSLSYVANLEKFLDQMRTRASELHLVDTECIGISVCLPSVYDPATDTAFFRWSPENSSGFQLKETIHRYFDCTVIASADAKLAAISCVSKFKQYAAHNMMYLCIDSNVRGALISDGNVVMGSDGYAGDLGRMLLSNGEYLEEYMLKRYDEISSIAEARDCSIADLWNDSEVVEKMNDYADCIAEALYNAVCVFSPYAVILDGQCAHFGEQFISRITAYLHSRLMPQTRHKPDILALNYPIANAVTGAGIRLREKWIKELN